MHVLPAALITYLREPEDQVDTDLVELVLRLTNELVDAVAGLSAEDQDPAGVTAIRLEVAARAYWNPNGYGGERMGDYTAPTNPGGRSGVYLTDSERQDLLGGPAAGTTAAAQWFGSLPYRTV